MKFLSHWLHVTRNVLTASGTGVTMNHENETHNLLKVMPVGYEFTVE
jgi:hypothetical protein